MSSEKLSAVRFDAHFVDDVYLLQGMMGAIADARVLLSRADSCLGGSACSTSYSIRSQKSVHHRTGKQVITYAGVPLRSSACSMLYGTWRLIRNGGR